MPCPICRNSETTISSLENIDGWYFVQCPACGKFQASLAFLTNARIWNWTEVNTANARGWIWEQQCFRAVQLDADAWEMLASLRTPSVGEKADKLLLWLAKEFPIPNQDIHFDPSDEKYFSRCWAADKSEAIYRFFTDFLR